MKLTKKQIIIIIVAILVIGLGGGIVATINLNNDINAVKEYIAAGEYEQAETVLKKQIGTNGDRQELYVLCADCYIAQGKYSEALDILTTGESRCDNNDDITAMIAEIESKYADELNAETEEIVFSEEIFDEGVPETSHGVSSELWSNIAPAIEAIGVPSESVVLCKLDDWADGERYSFGYEELGFRVYMNTDGTVNSINYGDTKFYTDGTAIYNANDYIVGDNRYQLIVWAQDAILANLKSPSTAEFAHANDHVVTRNGTTYTVSSYVDAQNSFGAVLRNKFTVQIIWNGTGSPIISDIIIE